MARVRVPLIPPDQVSTTRFLPCLPFHSSTCSRASPHFRVYRTYPARLGFQRQTLHRGPRPLPRLLLPTRSIERRSACSRVLLRFPQWDGGSVFVRVYARPGLRGGVGGLAGVVKLIVSGDGRVDLNDEGAGEQTERRR
jgi:hypothetical protein